jgi:excisionase family DNA binding protein
MNENSPKLLNLASVAEQMAVSPHTVRKWVRDGKLHPLRVCRRLLFEPSDIQRLIEASRHPTLGAL